MKKRFLPIIVAVTVLLMGLPEFIKVANAAGNVSVSYSTHVQKVGWQSYVKDGELSGTTGRALRLEGIKIKVSDDSNLGISYSTYIQKIGWGNTVSDDVMSGTTGRGLRLEAIKINLTGDNSEKYDVYYRVHAQSYGWLDWAKNGEISGTTGLAKRLEAIEIKIVNKGAAAPGSTTRPCVSIAPDITYNTHIQSIGWQGYVKNGAVSGTTGKDLRMEGIMIKVNGNGISGGVEYRAHVQKIGWQDIVTDDVMAGTSGKSLRVEAIKIKLYGDISEKYDVYYRTYVQKLGWLGWAKNGDAAGTEGYSYRLEAINIKLVLKGEAAPGSTDNAFVQVLTPENCTHIWGSGKIIKEPTCEETGIMRYTCSRCGATKDEEIKAKGHTYEWIVAQETTEFTTGLRECKCTECGDILTTEIIPKLPSKGEEGSWVYETATKRHKTMYDGTVITEFKVGTAERYYWGWFDDEAAKDMFVEIQKMQEQVYGTENVATWDEDEVNLEWARSNAAEYAICGHSPQSFHMSSGGLPNVLDNRKYITLVNSYGCAESLACFVIDDVGGSDDFVYGPYWRCYFGTYYASAV